MMNTERNNPILSAIAHDIARRAANGEDAKTLILAKVAEWDMPEHGAVLKALSEEVVAWAKHDNLIGRLS